MAESNKMKEMPVNKLMVQMGIPMILSMALHIMTRILLDRLLSSQDCHQSTLRKMQSYLQRKVYLHMPLQDVTLQEGP